MNSPAILYLNNSALRATYPQHITLWEMQYWGVLAFGKENNYPQVVEAAVSNCAPAKRATEWMGRFLVGDGFKDTRLNDIVVNKTGMKLKQLLGFAARQAAKFNAVCLHTILNPYGNIISAAGMDYRTMRLGYGYGEWTDKPYNGYGIEDFSFAGKRLDGFACLFDNWAGESVRMNATMNPGQAIWLPLFDSSEDFLERFSDYREFANTIYYKPLEECSFYPDSVGHPCLNDMMSWQDVSVMIKRELSNGFHDNYIVEILGTKENDKREESLRLQIQAMQGADNAGAAAIITGGMRDDDGNIVSSINIKPIERGNGAMMMKETNESLDSRIASCFGIEKSLLSMDRNAVFSSADLEEAYAVTNNLLQEKRNQLEFAIKPLIDSIVGGDADVELLPASYTATSKPITPLTPAPNGQ